MTTLKEEEETNTYPHGEVVQAACQEGSDLEVRRTQPHRPRCIKIIDDITAVQWHIWNFDTI